ncbi:MAG: T9SS type A sorting domain-containing protein, partial [Bacteroidales bacterium]|nr:T9SS type A sorting domain-containing protein [Bacteroidales bacterium]
ANGNDILCLKYDVDGELTNTYVFDGTAHLDDSAVDILIGESGNIYIGGISRLVSQRAFVLIKTDSELEDIWQKTHTLYYGADLRKIHFNSTTQNIAITGNYTDWENLFLSAVVVYDKDGNKILDEYYRTLEDRSAVGFDVIANSDNSYYVCGYEANEETNLWDALLMKYDEAGEILWSKKVYAESSPAVFKSMITDNSGNIYITGMSGENAITVKYDLNGNQIWFQTHSSKLGFSTVDTHESIKQSIDGDIFITARNIPANGGGAMLVKYDGEGEHQWTQYYNGSATQLDEPLSFCLDDSGNSYMILNSRNASYYNDMLTVMFLNQDSQLSPMIKAKNDINVYPNPANSKFFIENPYEERKQIKIYSVEGKCVYQTVNSDEIICISVENLPAGLYFIELKNGNNSSCGKFVIEK